MKIRPVGAELHAYRRTDMKRTVAFRNFAKAPQSKSHRRVTLFVRVPRIIKKYGDKSPTEIFLKTLDKENSLPEP
jgi:hypothetical protein